MTRTDRDDISDMKRGRCSAPFFPRCLHSPISQRGDGGKKRFEHGNELGMGRYKTPLRTICHPRPLQKGRAKAIFLNRETGRPQGGLPTAPPALRAAGWRGSKRAGGWRLFCHGHEKTRPQRELYGHMEWAVKIDIFLTVKGRPQGGTQNRNPAKRFRF